VEQDRIDGENTGRPCTASNISDPVCDLRAVTMNPCKPFCCAHVLFGLARLIASSESVAEKAGK
jgi:hypothetical protein